MDKIVVDKVQKFLISTNTDCRTRFPSKNIKYDVIVVANTEIGHSNSGVPVGFSACTDKILVARTER
jgi:hypothetical protein